eukprot:gene19975-26686_t
MGGECYRFIRIQKSTALTEAAKKAYKEVVLPLLVEAVSAWVASMADEEKNEWKVNASTSSGILVEYTKKGYLGTISDWPYDLFCPTSLDLSLDRPYYILSVGWQHWSYGSTLDPMEEIAESLMSILKKSPPELKSLLDEEQEDSIAADLGFDEPFGGREES